MNKPTPTTHGPWRVIDGQVVKDTAPPAEQIEQAPAPVAAEERNADPGKALPDVATPTPSRPKRRKAPLNAK